MRVVLGETSDPEEPVHGSRPFVAINGSQLCPAQRQLAVGLEPVLVYQDMKGTVHGSDLVGLILHLHLVEHGLLVEVEMSRCFPQVDVGYVGGVQQFVPGLDVLVLPEIFDYLSDARALRMPKHQTAAGVLLYAEEAQLLSEHAMVSLLCLLLDPLVLLELGRVLPACSVYSLQSSTLFITAPVRTCNGLQGNRLCLQFTGVLHVGTGTQVPPLVSDVIDCDGLLQSLQDLELVRFAGLLDSSLGLLAADFLATEWQLLADNLVHLLFYLLQVLLGERLRRIKVVVEAVVDPRSNRYLSLGEQPLYGHGHDVGRRMSHLEQIFTGLVGRKVHCLLRFSCGSACSYCASNEPLRI
mmetsp:Transcript_2756/g.8369  ORF Transcript_2756/g.8369 Transcript_2756/m.8369 type:complete len:354 (-) Transcript_2756:273-1334(-)